MNTIDASTLQQAIWPNITANQSRGYHHRKLVSYIDSELSLFRTHSGAFASLDRRDLISVISVLRSGIDDSQTVVIEKIWGDKPSHSRDEMVALRWIELAARLLLTVNVDSFELAPASRAIPPSSRVIWSAKDTSLRTLLQQQFTTQSGNSDLNDQRIPSGLTISGLCARSKVHVRWTDNLLDHLSVTEEKGEHTIVFYEHLVCLLNHQKYPDECAIPRAIIQEAVDTFVLLFPTTFREKLATKRFLRQHNRGFFELSSDELCGERKLELCHYPYWGKNIREMMAIMGRPARGWRQAVLDNEGQNFEQVVSIWVGTVATILTVVALGFGILSTVLAFKANRLAAEANVLARQSLTLGREANELARRSFELDRRQACLNSNATGSLADFCT